MDRCTNHLRAVDDPDDVRVIDADDLTDADVERLRQQADAQVTILTWEEMLASSHAVAV